MRLCLTLPLLATIMWHYFLNERRMKSTVLTGCLAGGLALMAWVTVGAAAEEPAPRLVNGTVISGAVQSVTAEGLTVQTAAGPKTYPWKYLSAGTRLRYEKQSSSTDANAVKSETKPETTNATPQTERAADAKESASATDAKDKEKPAKKP